MTTNPWPPEGTRVRVLKLEKDGTLLRIPTKLSTQYCVRLPGEEYWPVFERHEIEVIDGEH